jgi:hypothetical protein
MPKSERGVSRLLLVPTLTPAGGRRCIASFDASLSAEQALCICVYNGAADVESSVISDRAILIGTSDASLLAQSWASVADCSVDLFFGRTDVGRGYGGASNLLLALASTIGKGLVAKVDDDCEDTRPIDSSWLASAYGHHRGLNLVRYGHSTGKQSGSLERLPRDIATRLARLLYTQSQRTERLGDAPAAGRVLKNGILVYNSNLAALACYPILYDEQSRVHLRGEVYWWRHALGSTAAFHYDPKLALGHTPVADGDLTQWVVASLVGCDIWFNFRVASQTGGRRPSLRRRKRRLKLIRAWAKRANWPASVDRLRIDTCLDEERVIPFTDRIFEVDRVRQPAWKGIDPLTRKRVIGKTLPWLADWVERAT